jgi:hypothetical protein
MFAAFTVGRHAFHEHPSHRRDAGIASEPCGGKLDVKQKVAAP